MKILHISEESSLLLLRGRYLKSLGYEVVGTREVGTAFAMLRSGERFDALLLCHTLSEAVKLGIAGRARRGWGRPLIVELYLAETPVTGGIALEADRDFQPQMERWAESLTGLPERATRETEDALLQTH